jgi:hypothetical protein
MYVQSYWRVWSNSTQQEVKFAPAPKKAMVKLWHRAREFDRLTKRGAGRRGGAIGPTALKVLETLIFDFLNHRTGRLDPSYAAIARKANLCVRSVAAGIKRLKGLRLITWQRRCAVSRTVDGRHVLTQSTNAYAILPLTVWLGYREPVDGSRPVAGTWGEPIRMPGVMDDVVNLSRAGGSMQDKISMLTVDPGNSLALALAKLGAAMA